MAITPPPGAAAATGLCSVPNATYVGSPQSEPQCKITGHLLAQRQEHIDVSCAELSRRIAQATRDISRHSDAKATHGAHTSKTTSLDLLVERLSLSNAAAPGSILEAPVPTSLTLAVVLQRTSLELHVITCTGDGKYHTYYSNGPYLTTSAAADQSNKRPASETSFDNRRRSANAPTRTGPKQRQEKKNGSRILCIFHESPGECGVCRNADGTSTEFPHSSKMVQHILRCGVRCGTCTKEFKYQGDVTDHQCRDWQPVADGTSKWPWNICLDKPTLMAIAGQRPHPEYETRRWSGEVEEQGRHFINAWLHFRTFGVAHRKAFPERCPCPCEYRRYKRHVADNEQDVRQGNIGQPPYQLEATIVNRVTGEPSLMHLLGGGSHDQLHPSYQPLGTEMPRSYAQVAAAAPHDPLNDTVMAPSFSAQSVGNWPSPRYLTGIESSYTAHQIPIPSAPSFVQHTMARTQSSATSSAASQSIGLQSSFADQEPINLYSDHHLVSPMTSRTTHDQASLNDSASGNNNFDYNPEPSLSDASTLRLDTFPLPDMSENEILAHMSHGAGSEFSWTEIDILRTRVSVLEQDLEDARREAASLRRQLASRLNTSQ